LSVLIFFAVLMTSIHSHAAMNDYCITPPFIVAGVKPNLLMMIDNSASMSDLTYISSSGDYCYDTSYDDTKPYEGYFQQDEYYRYEGANGRFHSGSAIPVSCTYRTDYVCLNITGVTVDDFIAKGEFLNWLSSSKFDVQKKILTGGKYDTGDQILIGESRGCVGRRFIKRVLAFADITFAIRGPFEQEPDYTNPETEGGLTRIEIFKGTYDPNDRCQDAIDIWQDDDPLGQWMNAASDCLGISGGGGTASGRELATFIESVRGCYHIKNNIEDIQAGKLAFTEANLLKNVTINNLMTHCTNVYTKDCPDPNDLSTCAAILNNESGGSYICARTVTHLAPSAPYYSFLGSDTLGFAGRCWSDAAVKFIGNEACVKREFLHYCGGYAGAEVIDPSGSGTVSTADNIPAIIRDASVRSLGDPLTPAGSADDFFYAKVSKLTAPEGLIQEFSGLIRFGVMSFNYSGSPSECGTANSNITCPKRCSITTSKICSVDADCPLGETCVAIPNLDGGQVLHHIGYVGNILDDSVGDHTSGLIYTLDNITADTWTPFAEGFYNSIGYFAGRTDIRINPADFDETKIPVQFDCQKNNILLVSDGMSTADLRNTVNTLVNTYNDGDGQTDSAISATCPEYAGSRNLDDLAWLAKHRNINDFTETPVSTDPAINSKTITTFSVFNGIATTDLGECNPDTLLSETAENGGGTYQRAENPDELRQALREAFLMISGKAASGTAASVLASGEGTGANLVQAIFYPENTFGATSIAWIGSMKNMWYHIDPFLGSSTIREDTSENRILNLDSDYIVNFFFNTDKNLTEAKLFADADGDGVKDSATPVATVYFEDVKSLWEAGERLLGTSAASRTVYTTTNETSRTSFETPLADGSPLISLLGAPSKAAAEKLIEYVRGTDYVSKFCSSTVATACTLDSDCPAGETCTEYRNRTVTVDGTTGTWKLGDIVNSTPRISSWVPLNYYYKAYLDKSYKAFTEGGDYTDRGMVYVGANDGMLHAFNLGYLKLFEEKFKKAQLCNTPADCTTTAIGREEWAFIPKNALPYLQYAADPGYCHLYFTDLTPYIFDASIGCANADYWNCSKYDVAGNPDISQWKTILIGGMRLGGACKDIASSLGVTVPAAGQGYSSYFALDVTDQNDPQVLWEFSNADISDVAAAGTGKLGFATTGPAVVRINTPGDTDHRENGRWFVVFGSGPTGPIDETTHQFKGYSDQNLKIFILDLKTGALLRTIDTGIPYAFAGSLLQGAIDFDQNDTTKPGFYSDDAVYFGYTKAEISPPLATTKWNVGGVIRLFTKNSITPADWVWSPVITGVGPVTSGVAKLQNYKDDTVRLFFGTGRYFFKIAADIDDALNRRSLYGVKEPCYSSGGLNTGCSTTVSRAILGDVTSWDPLTTVDDADGWYIDLDAATVTLKAERNVTDPLATAIGAVFFTTTKPSADVCEFGGVSHLWAVKHDTGGAVSSSVLKGKALLQVSTGSIEEVSLKEAFTEKDGRRTPEFQGVPPAGAPPGILISPQPMDRILHIREQ